MMPLVPRRPRRAAAPVTPPVVPMLWFCLSVGLLSLLICLPLNALVVWFSRRLGFFDVVGTQRHKRGGRAVPNTGGVAIFNALAWPMIAAMLAVWLLEIDWWHAHAPPVAEHIDGLRRSTRIGGGVLTALAVMHLLGLYDDRRALGPYFKLGVQLLLALALVGYCDMRVLIFADVYGPVGTTTSVLLSVLWIVVVTNAMNFLDNMDGLAGGVGLIIAAVYLAATLLGGQWFVAALAAMLVGALAGFLLFNLPPARLYMGDGGSLVVGLLLAIISIRTTYFQTDPAHPAAASGNWYGLLMPVLVLALPLYDFFSVTLIRLSQGKSPFTGDQNHFSHRLARLGLSRPAVLSVVYLVTLATALGGVMLSDLAAWQAALVALQAAAILAVIAILERWGSRRAAAG